ncbi:MAG: hypothetical protein AB8G86_26410 [Saprospiraceae bacterium]
MMTQEDENELFRRFPRFERLSRMALEEELARNFSDLYGFFSRRTVFKIIKK